MSVNRNGTGKSKRKAPSSAWKKGQSGNPKGAPKRGESWSELWKKIGNMTPGEAADYCRSIAGQLATIGNDVTLKEAVVLRVFAALMFEPDARLLNSVMDRDEGKVPQATVTLTWQEFLKQKGYDPATIFERLVRDAATAIRPDDAGSSAGGNGQHNPD